MISQTSTLSDEQIEASIVAMIAGIDGTTERDFQRACLEYNSEFFRGHPIQFVVRACRALNEHFLSNTNKYWLKMSQNEFI